MEDHIKPNIRDNPDHNTNNKHSDKMPKSIIKLITDSKLYNCVKSVEIRRYFWSVFFCMRTEYTKIWARNNSVIGHFSRIVSASRFRKDLFRNIQDEIILEVLKATICLHMKKKSKIVCLKREEYLTTN